MESQRSKPYFPEASKAPFIAALLALGSIALFILGRTLWIMVWMDGDFSDFRSILTSTIEDHWLFLLALTAFVIIGFTLAKRIAILAAIPLILIIISSLPGFINTIGVMQAWNSDLGSFSHLFLITLNFFSFIFFIVMFIALLVTLVGLASKKLFIIITWLHIFVRILSMILVNIDLASGGFEVSIIIFMNMEWIGRALLPVIAYLIFGQGLHSENDELNFDQ